MLGAIFSFIVHLRAWITASIAVEALLSDFTIMGKLMVYTYYNSCSYRQEAIGFIYLWYLSEEFIGVAIVSIVSKKLMHDAMEK